MIIESGRIVQFGTAEEVYHRPAGANVMELLSIDGLNRVKVEVKNGQSIPWGIPAPVEDGAWLLCFRPTEVEADPAGPIRLKPDYAVVHNSQSRLASARIGDGSEIRFLIPETREGSGEVAFRPLEPQYFPLAPPTGYDRG